VIADLHAELIKELDGDGVAAANRAIEFEVDLRFVRQRWELTIPVASPITPKVIEGLASGFRREYARRYGEGAVMGGAAIEVVTLRGLGIGHTVTAALEQFDPRPSGAPAPRGTRRVVAARGAPPLDVPVFRLPELAPLDRVAGPALLDDVDTTIWVPPTAFAELDRQRNTIVEMTL
jgi:N-methylhydantoinase A